MILATKRNKTKEKETKSSKLQATVYYISHTCQFPHRLQEQEQQFANRLQEQEKEQEQEQEKEQEFEWCWRVLRPTISTLFYSVFIYMNNTYFSKCN